jgi:hypothetical protein
MTNEQTLPPVPRQSTLSALKSVLDFVSGVRLERERSYPGLETEAANNAESLLISTIARVCGAEAASAELENALQSLVTEVRAYQSPECDDEDSLTGPLLKEADAALASAKRAHGD